MSEQNTTGTGANTTAGAQANPTQAPTTPGAGTGPANPSPGTTTPSTPTTDTTPPSTPSTDPGAPTTEPKGTGSAGSTQDPQVEAALKVLAEKGVAVYTQQQFNGHMTAARKKFEADQQAAADRAAQEATQKALAEQGQFKPLYEQAQSLIKQHEAALSERDALIASLSQTVNATIDREIAQVPAVLREFDPGPENLAARMEWHAKLAKHPEVLRPQSPYGNGTTPLAVGNANNDKEARLAQGALYTQF